MYLRTLIGPQAGEIFDFSPEAASAMLADGRAVKAYPDPGAEEAATAPESGKTADSGPVAPSPAASTAPSSPIRGAHASQRARRR